MVPLYHGGHPLRFIEVHYVRKHAQVCQKTGQVTQVLSLVINHAAQTLLKAGTEVTCAKPAAGNPLLP
ncbi:hypothetical protein E2C01_100417 [Portunus trituberculatus]|uniref:Uncharacterized protein n=1 Tax=Portunus trituberculatus TaxID=210409 RepID=A0A5B7K7Z8_PORTR|nr:hypothetical protein [Portunus trituberculatus]